MAINIEVSKNSNESTANLIRRFTKRVQGAGIVQGVRKGRYFERVKSRNVRKTSKLNVLTRREAYNTLLKLGKIPERAPRK